MRVLKGASSGTIAKMGDDRIRKRQAKAEWATQKMRHEADKKRAKADAKIAKKRLEAGLPPEARSEVAPSRSARFADAVRGGLYLLIGASLIVAILLGQQRIVLSLDDLVESLFLATAGKLLLAVIGLAFVIYGLRKLGLMR